MSVATFPDTLPTIPAGNHKVNDKGERYFVFITNKNGTFTEVYRGLDYDRAVQTTNFWDERLNTFMLTHRVPMDELSVLFRKFDDLIESIQTAP
jgi:hypothetical protein